MHSLYAKTLIWKKYILFYHLYIHSYSYLSIWWRSFWIFANTFFSQCRIRVHFYRRILDIIIYRKNINLAFTEFIPGIPFNRPANTSLLTPETADIYITEELRYILKWAGVNELSINTSKTKELTFHWPNPRNCIAPAEMQGTDRDMCAKLLGVWRFEGWKTLRLHYANL